MLIIPAVGRLRQEEHNDFKVNLRYIMTSRPAWATECDSVFSKITRVRQTDRHCNNNKVLWVLNGSLSPSSQP